MRFGIEGAIVVIHGRSEHGLQVYAQNFRILLIFCLGNQKVHAKERCASQKCLHCHGRNSRSSHSTRISQRNSQEIWTSGRAGKPIKMRTIFNSFLDQ